ncbi:hypothetical protein F4774DRAFT_400869 [Daldinia eschscholtzii]|nr:hypothetical protein F4774DRAFT_400869 [Daldinia eschscholtzii]
MWRSCCNLLLMIQLHLCVSASPPRVATTWHARSGDRKRVNLIDHPTDRVTCSSKVPMEDSSTTQLCTFPSSP